MNKTIDIKDVYSWANAEEAEQYIGKPGLFSGVFYTKADRWHRGTLTEIHDKYRMSVGALFRDEGNRSYGLFVPLDKVMDKDDLLKEEYFAKLEKLKALKEQSRPFKNYDEFVKETFLSVSSRVHIHVDISFTGLASTLQLCILGCTDTDLILPEPIGIVSFTTLFDHTYLICSDGEFRPFGPSSDGQTKPVNFEE